MVLTSIFVFKSVFFLCFRSLFQESGLFLCSFWFSSCSDLPFFLSKFIGATNLPKMDLVGSADPYFVAKFDGHLSFV
jgi:hypothetical protein